MHEPGALLIVFRLGCGPFQLVSAPLRCIPDVGPALCAAENMEALALLPETSQPETMPVPPAGRTVAVG